MEVINRKSVRIKNGNGKSKQNMFIVACDLYIYFTAAITREYDIKVGEYMHFLNEGATWQFYMNDDTDGFLISPVTKRGGSKINSSALSRLIRSTNGFPITKSKRFNILKTGQEQDKCPVYEIKPI